MTYRPINNPFFFIREDSLIRLTYSGQVFTYKCKKQDMLIVENEKGQLLEVPTSMEITIL